MNILVILNGSDVTDSCRLQDTRISYDSTRRLSTASLTLMGTALNRIARYDYARYDENRYALDLRELYEVTILDGRDGATKLFEGQIYSLDMEQSDAAGFEVFYHAELNDWSAFLDRAVCWDSTFALTLPASDRDIILALLGQFCPQIHLTDIATIVPSIQDFDWLSKTARQVLDDLAALSMGEWRVDFDANLHYGLAAGAPSAPFALSTSPDMATSFPVKVGGYRHDFSNPINRAYVRGAVDAATGLFVEASYADPLSIEKYGEYAAAIVDGQITNAFDAALRAKSAVLQFSTPVEQGNFTIWKDGLECGMQVEITEENIGVSGSFLIRALTLAWEDKSVVRYEAQFGAAQPDLETLLRLMEQRSRWKTTVPGVASPALGSITDAHIAPSGLSAAVINSVNAGTIIGQIESGQIGSVEAATIEGAIQAGQIGSVNATSIEGVIVTEQLADKIIDSIAKYADALAPIPMLSTPPTLPSDNNPPNSFFYYVPDGHFYRISADGNSYALNDNPAGSLTSFYHIGAISANKITGLIVAAQIQSITAGQITGQIQASQIGSVNASTIVGTITAGQIASVNATAITGTIASGQIGSVNAATITIGLIQNGQIDSIHGGKIFAGTVSSQQLNAFSVDVGGGANMPGRIRVYNASTVMIAEIGFLDATSNYGGWFQVFGAGGSNYSNAVIKSDTLGNLAIANANFTVTNGPWTVSITPTTIDPTYSSLAVKVGDSANSTSHISRGIILYETASKIGSFNRAPGGPWAELVMGSGGSTIIIEGGAGTVRADGGFTSGGQIGQTRSVTISGTTLTFRGGICVGISP